MAQYAVRTMAAWNVGYGAVIRLHVAARWRRLMTTPLTSGPLRLDRLTLSRLAWPSGHNGRDAAGPDVSWRLRHSGPAPFEPECEPSYPRAHAGLRGCSARPGHGPPHKRTLNPRSPVAGYSNYSQTRDGKRVRRTS